MNRLNQFYLLLVEAQNNRKYMPMVDLTTPYWNTYEMLVLWSEVNKIRLAEGKTTTVPFTDVKRAEQSASGHIDYTEKFALYCSRLVDK